MKLDIDRYLNRDIISDFSKHIEMFDLHKIENEIIFFWQPKKGTIQDFEDSGSSFENYLENLFDSYKIDFGHCYLDPYLDFKEGIEYHYHLNPEEIQRVNNMETGEGTLDKALLLDSNISKLESVAKAIKEVYNIE